ncbi:hypothetical protein B296_00028038 [Ensete ventricosum]|uniref:Amine oxidase n=1 Tax=Ensete ventricosum TaxID=4639 RepID=A0A426ZZJ3_ENSVE|nr:hypothetical protein B296_00028038 [Ensete ventricosum]
MATTEEKATPCCSPNLLPSKPSGAKGEAPRREPAVGEWIAAADPKRSASSATAMSPLVPVEDVKDPPAKASLPGTELYRAYWSSIGPVRAEGIERYDTVLQTLQLVVVITGEKSSPLKLFLMYSLLWCVGYHSDADAPSHRLAKPLIFCRTESDCPMENGYARPVEGLYILVDMQNNVIIEFEDRKLVPLPPADPLRNYTPGETRGGVDRSDIKPLHILQPEGPSFRINGYFVEWQKVFITSVLFFFYI